MAKQPNQEPKKTCLIHSSSSKEKPEHSLICPQDLDSWQSLLSAAKLRNHQGLLQLADHIQDEQDLSQVVYHRFCRSIFTMKRDLERLKRKAESNECFPAEASGIRKPPKRQNQASSSSTTVYKKECIFCPEGKVKYLKGSHTREPLTMSCELQSDATLRQVAIEKQDEKIMAITSREIVAAEAHYNNYTRDPGRLHKKTCHK